MLSGGELCSVALVRCIDCQYSSNLVDVPALNRVEHLRSEVLRFHGSQTIRFLIIQGTEEAAGKSEGSEVWLLR